MVYYSEGYRGVHSTTFIAKGECLLYVPVTHIITLEMAKAAPIGAKMVAANVHLISPKHCWLSTFLLQEKKKGPESYWWPYLQVLPKHCNSFPIFFTDEEKHYLKGSPFLDQVNEKIDDIQEDWDTIANVAEEFKEYSIHEFSIARMTVSSRIFGMDIGETKTDGFVPYADMLNHRRPRQTSWTYCNKRNGFIIDALEDIPRGSTVMDSYGKKCNSRFLLNYGFINLGNDANEYPLKLELSQADPAYSAKMSLLNSHESKSIRCEADVGNSGM
jgi:histone-lysine N-methyltransferase SETD3